MRRRPQAVGTTTRLAGGRHVLPVRAVPQPAPVRALLRLPEGADVSGSGKRKNRKDHEKVFEASFEQAARRGAAPDFEVCTTTEAFAANCGCWISLTTNGTGTYARLPSGQTVCVRHALPFCCSAEERRELLGTRSPAPSGAR